LLDVEDIGSASNEAALAVLGFPRFDLRLVF